EDAIAPAMVMPFELQNEAAAGRGASEAKRHLHDFGAAVGEADRVRARDQRSHALGHGILEIVLRAKSETAADLAVDGFHNFRWRVAQDQRPPGETVVDIGVPIDIGDAGTVAGFKVQGVGPCGAPDTAGDAAGQRSTRTFETGQRTGGLGAHALFTLGGVKRSCGRSTVPGSAAYLY